MSNMFVVLLELYFACVLISILRFITKASVVQNPQGREIRWPAFGVFMIYIVTLSIFPGFIAEDLSSRLPKDRLVFYPLFAACLSGPRWLKTEIPMAILTFMLRVTNCYLSSALMILTPKSLSVSEAELSAIAMVVFLGMGLVGGSVIGYFWII
ncbi:hypothetical protein SADUNF_Sadunf18G0102100 [Salix dunnii]|uniref:Uncharacterized protein n=1 Tax=Salix dunnii TaxID=1413687 RepID=A0A835J4G0_9ROSI|nr:hypothetical protein SADUNF_Sadunf18G0102100 [Salix dunnii]